MKRKISIDYAKCRNCGICMRACRIKQLCFVQRKISVGTGCTACGSCVKACPFGAIIMFDSE